MSLNIPRTAALALMALGSIAARAESQPVLDDRLVTITSPAEVAGRRAELIAFVWGTDGFPSSALPTVVRNDASPVAGLENLATVNTLIIGMEGGMLGYAHHFVPVRSNGRAVILHHGHACTFDDDPGLGDGGLGLRRTLNTLLVHGYSVVAVYMPGHVSFSTQVSVSDCQARLHDDLMATQAVTTGSPLKFFLEPVAVTLNYLRAEYHYQDFSMVGLSGGGWTTVVYSAIDPSIKVSVQIAGSLPLYLQRPGPQGDAEQRLPAFYSLAGYPDLYLLGGAGVGRRQLQILNRYDDCCFSAYLYDSPEGVPFEDAVREYEGRVRAALMTAGSGFFRVEIDEAARAHTISWNTVINLVLAELNDARQSIGAASPERAFVRGMNGRLWQFEGGAWYDTGLPMVGRPAVVEGGAHAVDVFYRSPGNRLTHAYPGSGGWSARDLGVTVVADPAAVSNSPGQLHVVSFDARYALVHGAWDGVTVPMSVVSTDDVALGLGTPAAVVSAAGTLHVFFHGRYDRSLHYLQREASGEWGGEVLPSTLLDAPSAVIGADGVVRAYLRGGSNTLWETARTASGWEWTPLAGVVPDGRQIRGTPGVSQIGGIIKVHARMANGSLGIFERAAAWTFTDAGGVITGSPTSTAGTAHVRGQSGGLWLFSTGWISRSGVFY